MSETVHKGNQLTPTSKNIKAGKGGLSLVDNRSKSVVQQKVKQNNTGLPNQLKTGIENLSGHSMDDVKVHYNSAKPAQLNAHAYAQGSEIHLGAGQEKHLPHEAWHVVQQKQGRVKATKQLKAKVNINDDQSLEKEADVMGAKALGYNGTAQLKSVGNGNQSEILQFSIIEKLKSGFGAVSVGAGALATALLYSNPVGISVGAGLLATTAVSYAMGTDRPEPAPVPARAPTRSAKAPSRQTPGVDKKEEWRKLQEDKKGYLLHLVELDSHLQKEIYSLKNELRTAYRKLLSLQPLMQKISGRNVRRAELDEWRGAYSAAFLRKSFVRNQTALDAYESFMGLIEQYDELEPIQHLTKKQFNSYGSTEKVLNERHADAKIRGELIEKIIASAHMADNIITEELRLENEIKQISHHHVADVADAAPAHDEVAAHAGPNWFDTTYPQGWVHIAGNSYAAITATGAASVHGEALVMFQQALENGTIADRGTGASGVKWGKRELKVRRTRLESVSVPGDTRLAGVIIDVDALTSGLANDIRVLEFTHSIQAH